MATARESLLRAAEAALAARPWPAVRMVEVAAAAGVSRQTLYNEFGGKAGLGRALVRRAADWYLDGVDGALAAPAAHSSAERLAAVAEWTVRAGRARGRGGGGRAGCGGAAGRGAPGAGGGAGVSSGTGFDVRRLFRIPW
ncbi:TetR/AcrR family transcriptional regulator, partial [Streptomyces sp. NPDC031705]|uniref:TetR/AcrR family transcriptional regulator n=1 Tax=Streptomyces sp. NPDC031705 TaxID=3155729 RepID=UPI0033E865C9